MAEPESVGGADETEFWHSEPGAQEDLKAGRAARAGDLSSEAEIRARYGVTVAATADLMALVVTRRDGKTDDELQSTLDQLALGWTGIASRADAHRQLDAVLDNFAKAFGDQEPSSHPDAPYMGGG